MEFLCWFLQEKLGKNRGKSSWGRMVSLSSNFPFYSSSRIWRVHAVHLPKLSVPRTKRKGTACSGARRAASILLHTGTPKGRNGVQLCTPCSSNFPPFLDAQGAERRATVHAVLMFQRRASWVVWWTARRAALHGVQSLCCAKSNLDLLSRTPNALHTTPLASWSDHLSP